MEDIKVNDEHKTYMPKEQGLKHYIQSNSLAFRERILDLKDFQHENGYDNESAHQIDVLEQKLQVLNDIKDICKARGRF